MTDRSRRRPARRGWLRRRLATVLALASLATLGAAAPASAQFEILDFAGGAINADGSDATQAGQHPYAVNTTFNFPRQDVPGTPIPVENVKEIEVDMPPGFIGDPSVMPKCPEAVLADSGSAPWGACPVETQVGEVTLILSGGSAIRTGVYNMEAPPDYPALFGFRALTMNVHARVEVRSGDDYGITVRLPNITQALPFFGSSMTLWGVPGDPRHDDSRGQCLWVAGSCPSSGKPKPFLSNPTHCTGEPLETRMRVTTWQDPDTVHEASFQTPPVEGCDKLAFDPTITVRPGSTEADSPSGFEVAVRLGQDDNPDGLATAHLRDATVTLPEGVAMNPSAADGLGGCSDAEIALDSTADPTCPDRSKIGTVEIDTPVLAEPMRGSIYLGTQTKDDPYRIFLVAKGPGVIMKLPGSIEADPETGQLTTTFEDNPQQPFRVMTLRFHGGPRSPLVNPPTCGQKVTTADFDAWSGASKRRTSTFVIDSGPQGKPCADDPADRPLEPGLSAGVVNPVAGSLTPFVLRLTRDDGDQEIDTVSVTPPEGVTAILRNAEQCSEADIEANSCPESSKIGQVIVGVGAGSNPYYVQGGSVHLAGPYKGAPLSLHFQVPAVAGPFDLGMVGVRSAVHVDRQTAQLKIDSDRLPQILEGIPLRIRDLRVMVDKPGFMLAPTNCDPMQVEATVTGVDGASADLHKRFQVGDCAALGFKPSLTFQALGGKQATKRNAHPGLRANLVVPNADPYAEGSERASQANIKRVQVTLPKGPFLDQSSPALADPCTREEYADGNCPASSRVGTAVAHTPLLDEPLEGPVYLRTGDNPLPDLVADLDGMVEIDLVGKVSQSNQRIRNTFELVPDVPVSSFELRLDGGPSGMLVNSNTGKGLCGKGRRAIDVAMRAHNNRAHAYTTQLKAACGQSKAKARAKRLRRKVKQLRREARAARRAGKVAQAKRLRHRAQALRARLG